MDISLLAEQLNQEDPQQYEMQKAALTILLEVPSPDVVPLLVKVSHQFQDPTLLSLAINGLARFGSDEAVEALSAMLFEEKHLDKATEIARALGYSRNITALTALYRVLTEGLNSDESMPISESLMALANLCQAGVFMPNPEWETLIEEWKNRGGEYNILARHIRICWDGKIVIK